MIRKSHANFSHLIRQWACQDVPEPGQIRRGRFLAHCGMCTGHMRKQLLSCLVAQWFSSTTRDAFLALRELLSQARGK